MDYDTACCQYGIHDADGSNENFEVFKTKYLEKTSVMVAKKGVL